MAAKKKTEPAPAEKEQNGNREDQAEAKKPREQEPKCPTCRQDMKLVQSYCAEDGRWGEIWECRTCGYIYDKKKL